MDSSGKILVVDDEEVICNTLRLYLESQGFAVETANSGHEAIARIKEHEFEVVILDILMPQMNGLDVMRWINDRDAPVEVIITTGAGSHEVAVEAMRLGAFELLRKPILDFDEKLLLAVRQAGEHYRLKATLREKKADFKACAQPNPPGIGGTAFRMALQLYNGKEFKPNILLDGMTYYYKVGMFITDENFDEGWQLLKDKPDDYLLSEIMPENQVVGLFQ